MKCPETLFNILSDSTRLRILMLIEQEGELCVCEIMHALDESQPKISRHLAFMRKSGLVAARREGTWMHYRVSPEQAVWVKKILAGTLRHLGSLDSFRKDRKRLSNMQNRPGVQCA